MKTNRPVRPIYNLPRRAWLTLNLARRSVSLTPAMYAAMEAHDIPEGVIEVVAKKVHQAGWEAVGAAVKDLYSPMESMVLDAFDAYEVPYVFGAEAVEHFQQTEATTVLLVKLSALDFILFYQKHDDGEGETMLMEGQMRGGDEVVFTRFYRADPWEHAGVLTTRVEDYFTEQGWPTEVPFVILHYLMGRTPFDLARAKATYTTLSSPTGRTPVQQRALYDRLVAWFEAYTTPE